MCVLWKIWSYILLHPVTYIGLSVLLFQSSGIHLVLLLSDNHGSDGEGGGGVRSGTC